MASRAALLVPLLLGAGHGLRLGGGCPQQQLRKVLAEPVRAQILAAGLCALATPGVALAISADDYTSMYGSSATANEPGFSFSMPKLPEKKGLSVAPPKFDIPDVDLPKVPKFEAPKFEAPKFDAPKFDAPKFDAPKFEAPKFDAPKFDAPKFDAPKAPKFDAPKFDAPSAPKIDVPELPSLPSVSLPSFPSFGGGGGDSSSSAPAADEFVDREALDEEARETAADFRRADASAKAVEKEARALRKTANDKKKIAKAAKDAACEYRPGGKWLCIRGFKSGF